MKPGVAAVMTLTVLAAAPPGVEGKTAPAPVRSNQAAILYVQLSPERWRIGMSGLGAFDRAQVEHQVLRKAAKLMLSRGFDWFEAIGERPEPVESENAVDPQRPLQARADPGLRLRWGERCQTEWAFGADPALLCQGLAETAPRPFQATTQIMMGHGAAPRNGLALKAREVMKSTAG